MAQDKPSDTEPNEESVPEQEEAQSPQEELSPQEEQSTQEEQSSQEPETLETEETTTATAAPEQSLEERERAAKKRARERAKQQKDIERYQKSAQAARKKAAETRAQQAALENDAAYQEKKQKEAEKLKEHGRKEIERQRKKTSRKTKAAAKSKKKDNQRSATSMSSVERKRRQKQYANYERRQGLAKQNKTPKKSMRNSRSIACLAIIVVLAIASAIVLFPPQDKITMGLDIQGGVSVNLKASTADGAAVSAEEMEQAQRVITNRVNSSGAAAASVQQQGSDAFLVQVPGAAENSQAILDTLSSQGILEFVDVSTIEDDTARQYVQAGLTGMNLNKEGIGYTAFMTGDSIENVTVDRPQASAEYAVNLQLDSVGTQEFADMTRELLPTHGQIAILLDGVVESAPAVQAAITNGQVQITGNYTVEEANQLKTIIDSGSLPVSISIEQASTVGPTLGQQALFSAIIAALIGIALVIIWLFVFYKGLGLLPAVSIVLMSVIYLGLLALLSQVGWFSLTLPGIAGIIVNIGMSADSSILIMENFHEQIREGKSIKTASTVGVKEGIFTSLDADIVTLVSALILYFFAMGDVRGFGLTLALGIICDLIVMALFSGPIMRVLGPRVIENNPIFWGNVDDINEGKYLSKEAV